MVLHYTLDISPLCGYTRPMALYVGLIGYGLSGSVFHAPLVEATPGLTLGAVAAADPRGRATAHQRHPNARIFDSGADLLAADRRPDLVVVAAPNDMHVPLAIQAVDYGIPVIVDKPIAATVSDGERLLRHARERGVFLTVFQNRRWDGDFISLRSLVESGRLGIIHRLDSRFEVWAPTVTDGWREDPRPDMAAGLLVDLGAHLIDQSVQLFGDVECVYAELDCRRVGALVDDDSFVSLQFFSGVRAHLRFSKTVSQPGPRFHLVGSRGSYVKYGLDPQEDQSRAGLRPTDAGWGLVDPPVMASVSIDGQSRDEPVARGRYQDFYASVASSLASGSEPPVDPADGVYTLRIIGAAKRSAEERKVIDLPARTRGSRPQQSPGSREPHLTESKSDRQEDRSHA
jgi:predicted dehydrogenase